MVAFAIVGFVPHEGLRRWMNDCASLIAFRILARSICVVADFHNLEYRPKSCGFCVANHTTPMDVTVLASDCTFSLVSFECFRWCCTLEKTGNLEHFVLVRGGSNLKTAIARSSSLSVFHPLFLPQSASPKFRFTGSPSAQPSSGVYLIATQNENSSEWR